MGQKVHSPAAIVSSSGKHACVPSDDGQSLNIFATTNDAGFLRSISLPKRQNFSEDDITSRKICWSKPSQAAIGSDTIPCNGDRLLCCRGNCIWVWDMLDEDWFVEISIGDTLNIPHVEFNGLYGNDEIYAFAEYGTKLVISSLRSPSPAGSQQRKPSHSAPGQMVIKSPKFINTTGYSIRARTFHLAILLKLDGKSDVLSIHEPSTYVSCQSVILPAINAQGVKWSLDGSWIAVWDAPSLGTKLYIYTADGKLFRTYCTPSDDEKLGIKTVEWCPDSRFLALGKHDGTVELLNCFTFTQTAVMADPTTLPSLGRDVFLEVKDRDSTSHYILAPRLPTFPYNLQDEKAGNLTPIRAVHQISFNSTGDLVAILEQGLPRVVWIWSLKIKARSGKREPELISALIQSANVLQLMWHPTISELLMIFKSDGNPSLHQWMYRRVPRITHIPRLSSGQGGTKYRVSWMNSNTDVSRGGIIFLGWSNGYVFGYVSGNGTNTEFQTISALEAERCPDIFSEHQFPKAVDMKRPDEESMDMI